jgi:hypothetical protein
MTDEAKTAHEEEGAAELAKADGADKPAAVAQEILDKVRTRDPK